MKAKHKFFRAALGVVGLILCLSGAALRHFNRVWDQQEAEAKAYCEAFIPSIEDYWKKNGHYPAALNLVEFKRNSRSRSALLKPDFYFARDDRYFFRFRRPGLRGFYFYRYWGYWSVNGDGEWGKQYEY